MKAKTPVHNIEQLGEQLMGKLTDDESKAQVREALKNLEIKTVPEDVTIYRVTVIALAIIIIIATISICILMFHENGNDDINKKIPSALVSVLSGSLGALTGLLVPTPKSN